MTDARLHRWEIPVAEYARHERRRGRRHAYDLEPRATALVVVDMIPFFVDENPYASGIVANVNELAAAVRGAGGAVAWVVPAPGAAMSDEFLGAEVAARYRASGGDRASEQRISPAMAVDPIDLVVEKSAPSAFFPGRCDLDQRLRPHGIDTVIVAGTVANVCCESTVRDAATLGYRVVMVADANAATDDGALNATLTTVYRSFGDVRTTAEIVERCGRGGSGAGS